MDDEQGPHHHGHGGAHGEAHGAPGGLAVSAGGYTLEAASTFFEPGREEAFAVRIRDEARAEVRDLEE